MTSPITLGGFTTNGAISDTATTAPFSTVTVSDSILDDQVSATISFTAANGMLSGSGLSAGVVSNGTVTYSLSATTPAGLQAELQALTFTPTAHQGAAGSTVTTAFDLTVSDVTASPPTTPSATLTRGINEPLGVAIDAAGDVFVENEGNNTLEEFSPAGALVQTLTAGSTLPGAWRPTPPAMSLSRAEAPTRWRNSPAPARSCGRCRAGSTVPSAWRPTPPATSSYRTTTTVRWRNSPAPARSCGRCRAGSTVPSAWRPTPPATSSYRTTTTVRWRNSPAPARSCGRCRAGSTVPSAWRPTPPATSSYRTTTTVRWRNSPAPARSCGRFRAGWTLPRAWRPTPPAMCGGILQRRRAPADAVERDQLSHHRGDRRRRRCLRRERRQQHGGGILWRRRAFADAVDQRSPGRGDRRRRRRLRREQ